MTYAHGSAAIEATNGRWGPFFIGGADAGFATRSATSARHCQAGHQDDSRDSVSASDNRQNRRLCGRQATVYVILSFSS